MEVSGILDYLVGFAIVAGIYSVFSLGLNVHWGFTGLFNIGIAGFFALGAYTSALLTTSSPDPALFEDFKFGGNWAGLGYLDWGHRRMVHIRRWAAAALCCGVIALVIGYVTLRLRGDYLAIATPGNRRDGAPRLPERKVGLRTAQRGCTGFPSSWATG